MKIKNLFVVQRNEKGGDGNNTTKCADNCIECLSIDECRVCGPNYALVDK